MPNGGWLALMAFTWRGGPECHGESLSSPPEPTTFKIHFPHDEGNRSLSEWRWLLLHWWPANGDSSRLEKAKNHRVVHVRSKVHLWNCTSLASLDISLDQVYLKNKRELEQDKNISATISSLLKRLKMKTSTCCQKAIRNRWWKSSTCRS